MYDSANMRPRLTKFTDTENKMMIYWSWGEKEWEFIINVYSFSFMR